MTSRPPPVPPASRSPKAPGNQASRLRGRMRDAPTERPSLKEQDRQGNIKQNTTNQGHQQAC
jgi:hypothetical protein